MKLLGRRIQATADSGVEPERDRSDLARDEAETAGTSGGNRGTNGVRRAIYLGIVVSVFAFTLVNAISKADDAVRQGGAYDLGTPLLWEMTSAVAIVALLPLLGFGVWQLCREPRWPLRVLWVAGTVLAFSALHILGMVLLRKLAMAAAGGSYSFGFSVSESVYEFRKDVVSAFMIGIGFWFAFSWGQADPAEAAAASPRSATAPPDVLWLRDGSARIRIEAREIVGVSSAGNYVEYSLASGRSHLIRGTLAAEETRLARFNVVRVHRTRLVNLSRVTALKAGPNGDFELTLDTGTTIPGSRRYRDAVSSIDALASNSFAAAR